MSKAIEASDFVLLVPHWREHWVAKHILLNNEKQYFECCASDLYFIKMDEEISESIFLNTDCFRIE